MSYAIPLSVLLMAASCIRETWNGEVCPPARGVAMAVKIDWSLSGINTANRPVTDEVGRVSIRFFPADGSPAFDRYLDTDITGGTIDDPPGRYAVVAFNESIYDEAWWDGRIRFTDTESYAGFAAHLLPHDDAARVRQFPRYQPREGELIVVEPPPLASWSLDRIEIEPQAPRKVQDNALTRIVMRPLTHRVDVEVSVENLASAYSIRAAQRGLASTVLMASGVTADPSTSLFSLNGRRYDPGGRNGTTHASFLTFGRTPPPESYLLEMDVLLMDGTPYTGSGPLLFDVTGQVTARGEDTDIPIRLALTLPPPVTSGIAVDEWGRDREQTLN